MENEEKEENKKSHFSDCLMRYYFLQNASVNISPAHHKRSFLEAFCLAYIKAATKKLEGSSERCFAEKGFRKKATSYYFFLKNIR